jgi:hypothetical protein
MTCLDKAFEILLIKENTLDRVQARPHASQWLSYTFYDPAKVC